MKRYLFLLVMTLGSNMMFGQFQGLVVEQVDNGGAVKGKTYRIYVQLTNDSDRVDVVFGDAAHPLNIASTKPFFQDSLGGAMTIEVNHKMAEMSKTLKYDSWVTIGLANNYKNALNNFTFKFDEFEAGGKLHTTDGAWFCTPDHSQVYALNDKSKRVLIMQLTTEGKVTGTISLQGKTADGELWQRFGETFTCGK